MALVGAMVAGQAVNGVTKAVSNIEDTKMNDKASVQKNSMDNQTASTAIAGNQALRGQISDNRAGVANNAVDMAGHISDNRLKGLQGWQGTAGSAIGDQSAYAQQKLGDQTNLAQQRQADWSRGLGNAGQDLNNDVQENMQDHHQDAMARSSTPLINDSFNNVQGGIGNNSTIRIGGGFGTNSSFNGVQGGIGNGSNIAIGRSAMPSAGTSSEPGQIGGYGQTRGQDRMSAENAMGSAARLGGDAVEAHQEHDANEGGLYHGGMGSSERSEYPGFAPSYSREDVRGGNEYRGQFSGPGASSTGAPQSGGGNGASGGGKGFPGLSLPSSQSAAPQEEKKDHPMDDLLGGAAAGAGGLAAYNKFSGGMKDEGGGLKAIENGAAENGAARETSNAADSPWSTKYDGTAAAEQKAAFRAKQAQKLAGGGRGPLALENGPAKAAEEAVDMPPKLTLRTPMRGPLERPSAEAGYNPVQSLGDKTRARRPRGGPEMEMTDVRSWKNPPASSSGYKSLGDFVHENPPSGPARGTGVAADAGKGVAGTAEHAAEDAVEMFAHGGLVRGYAEGGMIDLPFSRKKSMHRSTSSGGFHRNLGEDSVSYSGGTTAGSDDDFTLDLPFKSTWRG